MEAVTITLEPKPAQFRLLSDCADVSSDEAQASACERPQGRLADPPTEGDEARGSRLPCGSLDGAESERLASREVDKETWGGPAFP